MFLQHCHGYIGGDIFCNCFLWVYILRGVDIIIFCNCFVQVICIEVTSFCCSPFHSVCIAKGSLNCANVSRSSAPAAPLHIHLPLPCAPLAPLPPRCRFRESLSQELQLDRSSGDEAAITKSTTRLEGICHKEARQAGRLDRVRSSDTETPNIVTTLTTYRLRLWVFGRTIQDISCRESSIAYLSQL